MCYNPGHEKCVWYPYYLNSSGGSRFFLPHDLFLQLVASVTFILTWNLSGQEQDLHNIRHSACWLAKNSLQLPVNQVELHQGWCCLKFLHQCSRAREERKVKKKKKGGWGKRREMTCCWFEWDLVTSLPFIGSNNLERVAGQEPSRLGVLKLFNILWLSEGFGCPVAFHSHGLLFSPLDDCPVCAELAEVLVHEELFLLVITCIVTCHQQPWNTSTSKLNH